MIFIPEEMKVSLRESGGDWYGIVGLNIQELALEVYYINKL